MRTIRIAILLLALRPAVAGETWTPRPGERPVGTLANLVLRDAARDKELQVRVTFPRGEGTFPVLLFSHGLYGSKDGYGPLVRFWAARGYVCIQPSHADSLALGPKPQEQALLAWSDRTQDVSFLLDSLDEIEKRLPQFEGRLDKERVGMAGHSFGAHTSQMIGGVTVYPWGSPRGRTYADPRVRCVLLISPQGRGGLFREESWKTLARPALILTGSKDTSPLDRSKAPEWRLDPYRLAPEGDKYLVWIEGAHHGFGGISGVRWRGAGPKDDEQVKTVQIAGLAFLDAYVRGDAKAKAWLRSGALVEATKPDVRVEWK